MIAQRLGHLHMPTGTVIKDSDVPGFPAQDVVCLVTGSQGEANAALSRIAIDDHRHVRLHEGDRVVLSARAIPGNEKAIGRVMNHVARRNVEIVTESDKHVHVSGHGSEEELKLVLSLVRPQYFVPIHGEFRQLARHARVAKFVTKGLPSPVGVITAEDGDVIRFDHAGGRIVDKAPIGRIADRRHAGRRGRRRGHPRSAAHLASTDWSCRWWRSTRKPESSRACRS